MSANILVVEDDTLTRFMMIEMCEELGMPCETVANGKECLVLLQDTPGVADIILMDIHMPDMSGVEVSSKIREADSHPPRSVPIIAVTADEYWHDEARCKAAGFSGVLSKPISVQRLKSKLKEFT